MDAGHDATAADVLAGAGPWAWTVEVCDCRDGLRRLPPNSVDAVVTDPPAGQAVLF